MKNFEQLVLAALDSGAAKATVISQEQIVLSREFYDICRSNSCGNFGRCWMCPPDIGSIDELMEKVRAYPQALIYQTIGELEDCFDIEGMSAAAHRHAQVSQRVQAAVKPLVAQGCFHLSCGGCNLCETCAKRENKPCRFPDKALVPMEGAGVDVYNTVKDTQLKYINGQNTVTYFGMVLFEVRKDV